jgi:hypothetical protein
MVKPDISPEILVEELIKFYPASNGFLNSRGLHCIICGEPVWGSLEELARDKKFTEEEITLLVNDLKALVASESV